MGEIEEGLFDDVETEETPTEEETPEIAEETETVEETAPEEPFLKIRYDKEEYGLSRDEAVELAQKGKNYDRLYEKYNTLNSSVEKIARANGMDVPTFIDQLQNSQYNLEVSREMQTLKQQYPDSNEDILRELAQNRVSERQNTIERQNNEQRQKENDSVEVELKRQLNLFKNEYPNLEPDKLDRQVYEYVRQGYTLLEAYNKWAKSVEAINREASESKARIEKTNEGNRKKSYGNTSNMGKIETDDFLSGFLKG